MQLELNITIGIDDILSIFKNSLKNKSIKYFYFLFALLLYSANLYANDIQSIGVPYVQNYPKSSYLSGNQNWSIAKDKDGIMYFGNAEGLLTFDGKYWQQYKMPKSVKLLHSWSSKQTFHSMEFGRIKSPAAVWVRLN